MKEMDKRDKNIYLCVIPVTRETGRREEGHKVDTIILKIRTS